MAIAAPAVAVNHLYCSEAGVGWLPAHALQC